MKNKAGDKINTPIDLFNDGIDATRYGIVSVLSSKGQRTRAVAR